jgi:hypothetical protein
VRAREILDTVRPLVYRLREQLIAEERVGCAFPDQEVTIHWSDGEDHEVVLDVATGEVAAGGGRGFTWPERGLAEGR